MTSRAIWSTASRSRSPTQTAEGYRLVWYHSTRKAELDAASRLERIERAVDATGRLAEEARLAPDPLSPACQGRRGGGGDRAGVRGRGAGSRSRSSEQTAETYRQERRGRPGAKTRYVRRRRDRFELTHRVELERLDEESRCDGVFPLVSNDVEMTEQELLLAYKRQPAIERRFEQLKTDFAVAPVY